jgi:AcrR family transcriptional regulator
MREAILAAAVDILHRHGAGALTVRSVSAAAGCSTSGVYTWFGGKNGLIEAIFVDGFQRFGAAQRDVTRNHNRGAGDLERYAQAYRPWALANPTHYMVMFGKAVPDFQPSDDALAAAAETFDYLVTAAREVISDTAEGGDPVEVAHHLWAGVHGYVSLELAGMDDAAVRPNERARRFGVGIERLLRGCAL